MLEIDESTVGTMDRTSCSTMLWSLNPFSCLDVALCSADTTEIESQLAMMEEDLENFPSDDEQNLRLLQTHLRYTKQALAEHKVSCLLLAPPPPPNIVNVRSQKFTGWFLICSVGTRRREGCDRSRKQRPAASQTDRRHEAGPHCTAGMS